MAGWQMTWLRKEIIDKILEKFCTEVGNFVKLQLFALILLRYDRNLAHLL